MPPPTIDFAALRARTEPMGEGRAAAVHARVLARHADERVRARVVRVVVPATAIAAATALVLVFGLGTHGSAPSVAVTAPSAEVPVPASAPAPAVPGDFGGIVLPDGSRVMFLSAGTELAQAGTQGRQSTLVRGSARFDVVHDARNPFRVTAGRVVIEDVGTVFRVRVLEDGRTHVAVEEGRVTVRGASDEVTLDAGASDVFPSGPATAAPATGSSARSVAPGGVHAAAPWKKLAQAGDYNRAYAALQSNGSVVSDDPDELLLAADAARLSGHPDRAVAPLRRLVARHPSDLRAGLASFTLGRVLLDDLGQPGDAAAAFAAAYAHGGPLAEDALAREVEAWSRAGDGVAAKRAADRYLAAYPNGRRAAQVRRLAEGP